MATDKPQITIYDNATGVTTVRDMTAEELAELEANAPQPLGSENDNIKPV